ncbi:unnamed protein product, partial [Cladocopium goreaui]
EAGQGAGNNNRRGESFLQERAVPEKEGELSLFDCTLDPSNSSGWRRVTKENALKKAKLWSKERW